MYKGITNFGLGRFCAVFSATEELSDGFCRGIQHFFSKNYNNDLIRMATTVNCFNRDGKRTIEYANISYDGDCAPSLIKVDKEGSEYIYDVYTKYEASYEIERTTSAYPTVDAIVLEEILENNSLDDISFEQYAYVFFNHASGQVDVRYNEINNCVIWTNKATYQKLVIALHEVKPDTLYLSKEAKATAVNTIQKILKGSTSDRYHLSGEDGLSMALGQMIHLTSKEKKIFKWYVIPCENDQEGIEVLEQLRKSDSRSIAEQLHQEFFNKGNVKDFTDEFVETAYLRNLLSIKAVTMDGFVPADIVGHYYSGLGTPTMYIRDSLMVARAFLYGGYFDECKSIINYIKKRPRKDRGEFYQRYDANGNPAEGLNNDVNHQLDSLGYYLSMIYQYYMKTDEVLTNLEDIEDIVNCIEVNQTYMGLIGPEGGVNEGVYGQAYIVSTNMFISGGLYHISKFLNLAVQKGIYKNTDDVNQLIDNIERIVKEIEKGIDFMWNTEKGYYNYGYSATSESIIERYDTPQYFSVLFGYPNTEKLVENNEYLINKAMFFEDGIGYSQQSYHHGPWIFNTAACAQYNLLIGKHKQYLNKLNWILKHLNNYYLAPEAIHAEDEDVCFNNPLTWACAEVVATIALKGF
ncbi:hypothetical protein JHL18_14080 [Clostridium sp. YIM B02505]|uniref:Uncharacterized protein n=1 Tax=Clostridium yunnanense TaxID=2800325 RepID=A0ABS1EQS5_9CLOT|nr:hypothetical protein [Clostridium yunnanense]MBK1811748.1 hypothetical protein [Clostridium yunnanense]